MHTIPFYIRAALVVVCVVMVVPAHAQEVHQDLQETVRAEVLEVTEARERVITGTDTTTIVQTVRARVANGLRAGTIVQFENDYAELSPGDRIFLNRLVLIDGTEYFELKDFDRRRSLAALGILFAAVLILITRLQGVRALASLLGSIAVIVFVLIPLLLRGYSPVAVSVAVAGVILALAIFITHGRTARATIAFFGTLGAVVITGALSAFWVASAKLTGFSSDASVYLNFSTQGALDFSGLLLGSIIIGALGVLDDVAITQASVVRELAHANPTFRWHQLYERGIRVGRDHIGSLVNTLALAYVGVSLPLVLLFARIDSSIGTILNQEVVAAELVRTFVGSIGLILAVPLTTALAAWWFATHTPTGDEGMTHAH